MTTGVTPAPSRRREQKDRTRRALRSAALELFATQGYDTTTTDQITERAGVSPRTFFRYFPTKESVLFSGEREWVQAFLDRYPQQPSSLRDLAAMTSTFVDLAPMHEHRRRALLLYLKAVASSATLRGRERDHQHDDATHLAAAVAARRGKRVPDERATLLATLGMQSYWRAVDAWLRGPARARLGPAITREFELLASVLDDG